MGGFLKSVFGVVFSGTAELLSRNCELRFAEKVDAVAELEGLTPLAPAGGLAIAHVGDGRDAEGLGAASRLKTV
jgi:hypothetical protein